MLNTPQVQNILRSNQQLGIALGNTNTLDVQHEEDYTVIPIHVRDSTGEAVRVYEDGILIACQHVDHEGDAITFNDGYEDEYTVAAEVCVHCDAWYSRAEEDWIV